MIEITGLNKSFDDIKASNEITLTIPDACVYGLLGTNGAGKSTLIRMMAGILKPDSGSITIDDMAVWDNPEAKSKLFYISDDQFYFPNCNAKQLAEFYKAYYPDFNTERFLELMTKFTLDINRKITTFSKGMKKQVSILAGICAGTKYLLCDETFDGLDPVIRQAVKSLLAEEIDARGLTPVIASHNLRELEDICDMIAMLHRGGVILSRDLAELKCNLIKVQAVVDESHDRDIQTGLKIRTFERRGKLATMIVEASEEEALEFMGMLNPVFVEALPLSLEEIFIAETEVIGYDIKNIIF